MKTKPARRSASHSPTAASKKADMERQKMTIIVLSLVVVGLLAMIFYAFMRLQYFSWMNDQSNMISSAPLIMQPWGHMASGSGKMTGTKIDVTGTVSCLPHVANASAQNLACAIGLLGNNGKNYVLINLPQGAMTDGQYMNKQVHVTGMVQPSMMNKSFVVAGALVVNTIMLAQ